MALISCPECGKQISESASACPHCGYRFSADGPVIPQPAVTEIGALKKNVPMGLVAIFGGLIVIPVSIPFIGVFGLGIFSLIGGLALLGLGIGGISGMHDVICPHCKKEGKLSKGAQNYKCSVCKKRSVRDGGYLKPVQ